jgi:hypothetical protein
MLIDASVCMTIKIILGRAIHSIMFLAALAAIYKRLTVKGVNSNA